MEQNSIEQPQISIELSPVDKQNFVAGIKLNTQQPILGTAFHLSYDENFLQYLSYQPGDFFGKNQQEPIYLVKEGKGKIYVGISLRNNQTLTSGEGSLLKLNFQPLKEGKGVLNFEETVLSTMRDGQRENIEANWQNQQFNLNNLFQLDTNILTLLITGLLLICALFFIGWRALGNKKPFFGNLQK